MPYLVQILLPLYVVRAKLTETLGGLTPYTRAPADGLWDTGSTLKDKLVPARRLHG